MNADEQAIRALIAPDGALAAACRRRADRAPTARSGFALSIFRKHPDGKWRITRDANLLPPPAGTKG